MPAPAAVPARPGGAPRGVLLITAGGSWEKWLRDQNRQGYLRIVYDKDGDDPNDPNNTNCTVRVNTPSSYEVRGQDEDGNDKIYLKPGTEVTVLANCDKSNENGGGDDGGGDGGGNGGDGGDGGGNGGNGGDGGGNGGGNGGNGGGNGGNGNPGESEE